MQTPNGLELHEHTVRITWCSCQRCSATGPRFMTLIRNHREYRVELDSQCCAHDPAEEGGEEI